MLDIDRLRSLADTGDLRAQTELGRRLLVGFGAPLAPAQGAKIIAEAARRGDGEAFAQMSLLAGAGVLRPRNWGEALDHLVSAAERGWAPAQVELAFLSGGAGQDWRALRARVDIEGWLRPAQWERISAAPRMALSRAFIDARMCAWLIERARPGVRRATVYDPGSGALIEASERTNSEVTFSLLYADLPLLFLQARIAEATRTTTDCFETTKVLRYAAGEVFKAHYDFLDGDGGAMSRTLAAEGQRVLTALVYLNDEYDGGETAFPLAGFKFKARVGDALIFFNTGASGAPDKLSLHAGLAPTRGEKWVLSQWIRTRQSAISFNPTPGKP